LATGRDTQGAYELLEVDAAVLVAVKDVKDVAGKLIRVAKGEELLVDFAEFGFVQLAAWAIP